MTEYLAIVCWIFNFMALGLFLYRWHGGGFFSSPRWLQNTLWALPFAALAHSWPVAAIAFLCCFLGVATGHGNGQSLGHTPAGKPEKLEYLILWLKPHLSASTYDDILLLLCGIAMVSGGIIACLFSHIPVTAALAMLGATFSPLAYNVGWMIYPEEYGKGPRNFNQATQIGEALTGALCYSGLSVALLLGG